MSAAARLAAAPNTLQTNTVALPARGTVTPVAVIAATYRDIRALSPADADMWLEHGDAAWECHHGHLPGDRRVGCPCWDFVPGVRARRLKQQAQQARQEVRRAA